MERLSANRQLANHHLRSRCRGFTLLEVCLAIFIALLIIGVALPSVEGLFDSQREQKTFQKFDDLVQKARTLSVTKNQNYQITFEEKAIVLAPETAVSGSSQSPAEQATTPNSNDSDLAVSGSSQEIARIDFGKNENYAIDFPAALADSPPPIWVFWPSGNCEPAVVKFSNQKSTWTATYDPLTANAKVIYAHP